jgi:hypothetical protein
MEENKRRQKKKVEDKTYRRVRREKAEREGNYIKNVCHFHCCIVQESTCRLNKKLCIWFRSKGLINLLLSGK